MQRPSGAYGFDGFDDARADVPIAVGIRPNVRSQRTSMFIDLSGFGVGIPEEDGSGTNITSDRKLTAAASAAVTLSGDSAAALSTAPTPAAAAAAPPPADSNTATACQGSSHAAFVSVAGVTGRATPDLFDDARAAALERVRRRSAVDAVQRASQPSIAGDDLPAQPGAPPPPPATSPVLPHAHGGVAGSKADFMWRSALLDSVRSFDKTARLATLLPASPEVAARSPQKRRPSFGE